MNSNRQFSGAFADFEDFCADSSRNKLTNELFFFIVCPHDSNDCMNFESIYRAVTEISLHPQALATI
ncbi:hypothetical protein EHN06_09340 [Marinobacter sp. NP-4(2019)]|uniref:hypothetical protein n=1 Tax=Marinobacter sp. NP-4(2019) TaxID=2488665 RepID=UPI000FC3DDB0|nr:hypothetical protein [Marinobacter sp. NP-4(2019)]AZT83727.1 hypothetical protein EHN06_09340 [Marinobacter sp. NP-4(2019)]